MKNTNTLVKKKASCQTGEGALFYLKFTMSQKKNLLNREAKRV